jgi:hypothetical protein
MRFKFVFKNSISSIFLILQWFIFVFIPFTTYPFSYENYIHNPSSFVKPPSISDGIMWIIADAVYYSVILRRLPIAFKKMFLMGIIAAGITIIAPLLKLNIAGYMILILGTRAFYGLYLRSSFGKNMIRTWNHSN